MIDWDGMLQGGNARPPVQSEAGQDAALATWEASAGLPGTASPDRTGDDRRRCLDCAKRAANGRCMAAAKGELVASRSYTPNADCFQRCKCFAPLPSDPDQRAGRDRWPGL